MNSFAIAALSSLQALEDNQVQVQGMIANRYMVTFKDEILGWQKKLNDVADVNQIMSEIQRTWAYLESLFIHSEEVKKELPEATVRFANIDTEVKKVGCRSTDSVLRLIVATVARTALPDQIQPPHYGKLHVACSNARTMRFDCFNQAAILTPLVALRCWRSSRS